MVFKYLILNVLVLSSAVFAGSNEPSILLDGSKLTDCVYKEGSPFVVIVEQASCSNKPFKMCVGSKKCIREYPNGEKFWYSASVACRVFGDVCPSADECGRKDERLKEGETIDTIHKPKVETSALFERHSVTEGLAHDTNSPFALPLPLR